MDGAGGKFITNEVHVDKDTVVCDSLDVGHQHPRSLNTLTENPTTSVNNQSSHVSCRAIRPNSYILLPTNIQGPNSFTKKVLIPNFQVAQSSLSNCILSNVTPSMISNAGVISNLNAGMIPTAPDNTIPNTSSNRVPSTNAGIMSSIPIVNTTIMSSVPASIMPSVSTSMPTTISSSMPSTIRSSLPTTIMSSIATTVMSSMPTDMSTNRASNINTSGISNVSIPGIPNSSTASGPVAGGNSSLLTPGTVILLPPHVPGKPLQISADPIPILGDPDSLPKLQPKHFSKKPKLEIQNQAPREAVENPPQKTVKLLPKGTVNTSSKPMDVAAGLEDNFTDYFLDLDEIDAGKTLSMQSRALDRLTNAIYQRNFSMGRFINSENNPNKEQMVAALLQSCKKFDEIRVLVQEQNKLVQEKLEEQNNQMLLILEADKRSQEQYHKQMQTLEQQISNIQQQLLRWSKNWSDSQNQQQKHLEVLEVLRNMKEKLNS